MITAVLCSTKALFEIQDCLTSLFNQTKSLDSIIVVLQGVDEIDSDWELRYPTLKIFNIEQRGLSHARNFAQKYIKTDYVLYVDDDAFYPPIFIEKIHSHPDFGVVDVLYLNYRDPDTKKLFRKPKESDNWKSYLRHNSSSICITARIKAPSFELGFDENLGLGDKTAIKSDEDTDFLLRLARSSASFSDAPDIISEHSLENRKTRADYNLRVKSQGAAGYLLSTRHMGTINLIFEIVDTLARLSKAILLFRIHLAHYYLNRLMGYATGFKFVSFMAIKKIKDQVAHKLSIKLREKIIKYRLPIINTDFSIISNNCTGGHLERDLYGYYTNPFVNMTIPPASYVLLANNFDYYINLQPRVSNHSNLSGFDTAYPIIYLGKVEIHYIHYSDNTSTLELFLNRIKRIKKRRFLLPVERDGFNKTHFHSIQCPDHQKYFIKRWGLSRDRWFSPFFFGVPAADISIGYLYAMSKVFKKLTEYGNTKNTPGN